MASTIVAVTTAPLAVYALFQTRKALGAQSAASDIQTVLALWDELDQHWVRFRKAQSDDEKEFEFGQLTSYYELACGLFKDDIFSTRAARTLEEHLDEILPRMRAYPDFRERFERLKTSEETFANIDWFCGPRKAAKITVPAY